MRKYRQLHFIYSIAIAGGIMELMTGCILLQTAPVLKLLFSHQNQQQ